MSCQNFFLNCHETFFRAGVKSLCCLFSWHPVSKGLKPGNVENLEPFYPPKLVTIKHPMQQPYLALCSGASEVYFHKVTLTFNKKVAEIIWHPSIIPT